MKQLIQLWKMLFDEEGILFTYALAFSLLLTLAPSLLIFVLLFASTYVDFTFIEEILIRFLPNVTNEQVQHIVYYFVNRDYSLWSFLTTICASFYLASKSIYAFLFMSARNEKLSVSKWYLRIISLWFYVSFVLLIGGYVQLLYPYLAQYGWLRWLSLWFFLYYFYHRLSFRKHSLKYAVMGSLVASILFSILASLFMIVIQYFTSYQVVYGPLATFVTVILAIYLISCIIYIGFCWNIIWQKEDIEQLPYKNIKCYVLLQRWIIYLHHKIRKKDSDEDSY